MLPRKTPCNRCQSQPGLPSCWPPHLADGALLLNRAAQGDALHAGLGRQRLQDFLHARRHRGGHRVERQRLAALALRAGGGAISAGEGRRAHAWRGHRAGSAPRRRRSEEDNAVKHTRVQASDNATFARLHSSRTNTQVSERHECARWAAALQPSTSEPNQRASSSSSAPAHPPR